MQNYKLKLKVSLVFIFVLLSLPQNCFAEVPSPEPLGRDDPFKPPFASTQIAPKLFSKKIVSSLKMKLVGVVEGEAIVEINGKSFIVAQGNKINNMFVKSIKDDQIILTKGKKVYILPLGKIVEF